MKESSNINVAAERADKVNMTLWLQVDKKR
jgi:hypothetical protein